jgi:hypothetical protein
MGEFKLFPAVTITGLRVVFYFGARLPSAVPNRCTVVVSGVPQNNSVIAK